MSIKNSIFKIFNGSTWDEYHHKTNSGQVVHSKEGSNEETTVKEELDGLNHMFETNLVFMSPKTLTDCNNAGRGVYEVYNANGSGNMPPGEVRGMTVSFSATNDDLLYQLFLGYSGGVFYRLIKQGISYGTWAKL